MNKNMKGRGYTGDVGATNDRNMNMPDESLSSDFENDRHKRKFQSILTRHSASKED